MNRIVQLALVLVLLTSCKEITFKEPQPKGKKPLATIPKKLQGNYLTVTEEGSLSKDTVVITAKGYRFGYSDPAERAAKNDEYEEGVLSDTLVMKYYKGYYFVNVYKDPVWLLRVLKQEKNGDLSYMALEEGRTMTFNEFLDKVSIEIRVDSTQVGDQMVYQIDPTPSKFIELIDKGFFTSTKLVKVQ